MRMNLRVLRCQTYQELKIQLTYELVDKSIQITAKMYDYAFVDRTFKLPIQVISNLGSKSLVVFTVLSDNMYTCMYKSFGTD
jgi:hypothetical protein